VLVRGRGAVRGVVGLLVVVFWLEVHPVSLVGGLCLWRRRTARALGGQQCSHGSRRVQDARRGQACATASIRDGQCRVSVNKVVDGQRREQ
jgi:hypothetical protein